MRGGEIVGAYFDWLTRAEETVARLLPAAEANLFNSVAPPLGKDHDVRCRGGDAILAALGRRLVWLEDAVERYQGLAESAFRDAVSAS